MIRTSALTEQFDEAFAKAQAKFEAAVKSNMNPAFRSKYADVSSIIDATLEHLNSEGIGVKQHPGLEYKTVGDGVEAFMTVTTRLTYKGQWEESELAIPAVQRDRFDAQSCGSALTYACRYALQGIFVVRREDDDANAATGTGTIEAAKAVGKAKVAAMQEKAGKSPADGQETGVKTLFWTTPDKFNSHRAVFLNLREFGAGLNEVAAEGLKRILLKYLKGKGDEVYVPTSGDLSMDGLLAELESCGVATKKLAAND